MLARLLLPFVVCLVAAAPAAAKEYYVSRFDSRIEVRDDGSLMVTETIAFVFEEGTFRKVFRTIPTRRTDGIEFISASMDGRPFGRGTDAGQVEVRRKNGIRVEWHFTPVSGSSHAFELVYLARGVIRHDAGSDLLAWRALPTEHDYRIIGSAIEIHARATPVATEIKTRRVDDGAMVTPAADAIRISAASIRRNGWVEVHIRFPAGALVQSPPLWQQRRLRHLEMAPTWLAVAGGILGIGLMLLVALRQSYDAPPRIGSATWTSLIPPDDLPPALAGSLAANGGVRLEHAMAALFGLAERGAITIREETRGAFGTRKFEIERGARGAPLGPHESVLLDVCFKDRPAGGGVPLGKARSAVTRHWKVFREAVEREMQDAGLLDAGRRAHRRRYGTVGMIGLFVAAAAAAMCLPLVERFGAWPFLMPLAVVLVSLASFLFAAAGTPLSNEGVRKAEAWRAYQRHLKTPQDIEPRWGATAAAEARILPYAVALGLAAAWAKFMKKRNVQLPGWFHPAAATDSGPAFAAFIAYGGAGAHSGGAAGGGGGGAAGGGGSGAG